MESRRSTTKTQTESLFMYIISICKHTTLTHTQLSTHPGQSCQNCSTWQCVIAKVARENKTQIKFF